MGSQNHLYVALHFEWPKARSCNFKTMSCCSFEVSSLQFLMIFFFSKIYNSPLYPMKKVKDER